MGSAKQHVDELLKLPASERSEAAEMLLLSLEPDGTDSNVERAWLEEIQRRLLEMHLELPRGRPRRGTCQLRPGREAGRARSGRTEELYAAAEQYELDYPGRGERASTRPSNVV